MSAFLAHKVTKNFWYSRKLARKLLLTVLVDVILYFAEKLGREYEFIQVTIIRMIYFVIISGPIQFTLIYEYDMLADAEHRVHVVGVDDCSNIIFMSDIGQQFVDHYRCARIEAGVGLVAKEVFGIECDGSCYGYTFLHTA